MKMLIFFLLLNNGNMIRVLARSVRQLRSVQWVVVIDALKYTLCLKRSRKASDSPLFVSEKIVQAIPQLVLVTCKSY